MTTAFIADCGHLIPALPDDHIGGTGYGLDAHGKTRCYACCAEVDRAEMLKTSRAVLYFVNLQITNWPGSLRFDAFNITRSRGSGFGHPYDIVTGRFRGPDGSLWVFRNAGDNQIARCRRLRTRDETSVSIAAGVRDST
jgi:hypothetical protein